MQIRKPRRIHAAGSYGHMNYGDDLFVDTIIERSHDLWPGAIVRTFAPLKSSLYAQNGIVGKFLRISTAIAGLAWADMISFCGGSILQDVRGVDRVRNRFLTLRRAEAIGVSLGPFKDGSAEDRTRDLVQKLDRLVVRDKASVERWQSLNMGGPLPQVGGDIVALNPSVRPTLEKSGFITICPSAASGVSMEVLSHQVLGAVQYISESTDQPVRVQLLALSGTPSANDFPICLQLAHHLRSYGFEVQIKALLDVGKDGITKALTESKMVFSQRLHGAIVAYLAETPFLIVGHHEKCVDFATDIGLNESRLVTVDDSWIRGVKSILSSDRQAEMSPDSYRKRAESVYL